MKGSVIYVGLDVHKETIVIARASGRTKAEVVRKIANDYAKLCKVLSDLGRRNACGYAMRPDPRATSWRGG